MSSILTCCCPGTERMIMGTLRHFPPTFSTFIFSLPSFYPTFSLPAFVGSSRRLASSALCATGEMNPACLLFPILVKLSVILWWIDWFHFLM